MISDESDRFNPRDPRPADAGKPSKSVKRREARQLATQALYQWHMAEHLAERNRSAVSRR